jgi:hypothetical protein
VRICNFDGTAFDHYDPAAHHSKIAHGHHLAHEQKLKEEALAKKGETKLKGGHPKATYDVPSKFKALL